MLPIAQQIEYREAIEGAQHGRAVMLPIAQQIKYREARRIDDDCLAIDEARPDGQRRESLGNQGKTIGEVVAIACEQPHVFIVAPRQDTETVVLNFVNPIWTRRRLLCRTGQAWLDGGFAVTLSQFGLA